MRSPIYFLHGFLGLPSMWRETHRLLGEPIADSAILPGHGPEPWFPPMPGDFSSAVDALAKTFPFSDPAVVVGYSMGARVALGLALRHPHLVRAAVLVGVDAGLESNQARDERIAWDDEWAERAAATDIASFATAWESLPIFDTQRALSEDLRRALHRQRTSHTSRGIAWALRSLGTGRMPSMWTELASSGVSLTLVAASLDTKFVEKSRAIRDRSKHARSIVVEAAGHNVVLEAPRAVAEAVASAL